jgi:hypothetical protein
LTIQREGFPLAAQHRGIRFELGSEQQTMRLLLTMVRDHVCTVEEALACLNFDEPASPSNTRGEHG